MLIIIAWKTSQIWTYLSPNKRNDTFLRLVATESHLGRSAKVRNQCAIWCNLTSLSCSCNVQTSYSTTEGIADQKMHRDTCRVRLLRPHYLHIFEHCLPHMKWCITVWKMTHNAEWSHDRHWRIHAATRLRCHRSKTFTQLAWWGPCSRHAPALFWNDEMPWKCDIASSSLQTESCFDPCLISAASVKRASNFYHSSPGQGFTSAGWMSCWNDHNWTATWTLLHATPSRSTTAARVSCKPWPY